MAREFKSPSRRLLVYRLKLRFVYRSTRFGKVVPLTHCYECGSVISDQAMACPQCGAPKRNTPSFQISKFPKWFHLISFSLFCIGIILLTISGFSDAWFAENSRDIDMEIGLTHLAIDCSEINDEEDKMGCKLGADMLSSGQTAEEYVTHAGLESVEDIEEYAENLPEEQSILIGDLCNNPDFYKEESDVDECREMETAGFAGIGLGMASILTGTVALILIFLNLLMFENEDNISTASTLAILSTIMAIVGFFAWIILLPDDMFADSDTGWAYGLAITSWITMAVSSLMMIAEIIASKVSKPPLNY